MVLTVKRHASQWKAGLPIACCLGLLVLFKPSRRRGLLVSKLSRKAGGRARRGDPHRVGWYNMQSRQSVGCWQGVAVAATLATMSARSGVRGSSRPMPERLAQVLPQRARSLLRMRSQEDETLEAALPRGLRRHVFGRGSLRRVRPSSEPDPSCNLRSLVDVPFGVCKVGICQGPWFYRLLHVFRLISEAPAVVFRSVSSSATETLGRYQALPRTPSSKLDRTRPASDSATSVS